MLIFIDYHNYNNDDDDDDDNTEYMLYWEEVIVSISEPGKNVDKHSSYDPLQFGDYTSLPLSPVSFASKLEHLVALRKMDCNWSAFRLCITYNDCLL